MGTAVRGVPVTRCEPETHPQSARQVSSNGSFIVWRMNMSVLVVKTNNPETLLKCLGVDLRQRRRFERPGVWFFDVWRDGLALGAFIVTGQGETREIHAHLAALKPLERLQAFGQVSEQLKSRGVRRLQTFATTRAACMGVSAVGFRRVAKSAERSDYQKFLN